MSRPSFILDRVDAAEERRVVEVTALAQRPPSRDETIEQLIVEAARHYTAADHADAAARELENEARLAREKSRTERALALAVTDKLRRLGIS